MTRDSGTVADDPLWTVVVPVKTLASAKTRLAPIADADRAALALAMATDTVAAALACPQVAAVVVVTDDPAAAAATAEAGASIVPDQPDAGLNEALVYGAQVAVTRWPGQGVAALAADLPAMRPDELTTVLSAAGPGRSVLADSGGHGTVLLMAPPGVSLDPAYGADSLNRHVAGGAVLLTSDVPGLRRDVDTRDDLVEALRLGCGPRTTQLGARVVPESAYRPARAQATVQDFDPVTRAGVVVFDDGSPLVFDGPAFDRGGLRLLRAGQRVRVETLPAEGGARRIVRLTIVSLAFPEDPDTT
jgi:2-phospho-L-lactate/phosphoenolpyruvate guanylyltransferase